MQRLPVSVTTLRRARAGALLVCALAIAVGNPPCGRAQVPSRYTTGGEILRLDFASTAIGDFPAGIKTLNGTMDIVEKDGLHMLRASSPSEVLLKLPQVLPEKFTIELDIVPKACCAPDDIAIEGTDMDHRGSGTAQITWQSPRISVVGGAPDMYQAPMPDALQVSTPGVLTHIVLTVENETIQLYTNGRRLFTLTDRKFARRNVLWLMLGGADDGPNALYLARLRIINNTVLTPNNAGQCPPGTVTCSAKTGAPAPTPNPPTEPQTGSGAPAPGKTTPGPSSIQTTALRNPNWGGTVSWTPVPNAIGYRVHRTISGGTPAVVVDLVTNGPNQCVSAGTPTSALPCSGIDPFVLPVVLYDYWVEAVFGPSGTLSAPSAMSTVETGEPPALPDLNASVGGTKLVTGPGALSSLGAISGSEVTWTWDPTGRGQFAYLFSYEIVGGMTGVGPVIERGSVRNQDPLNGTTTMTVVRGVPQGKQVKFCVAFFADPDVTKPFDPRYSKCLVTQVP
jgi:hypothetical protein